MTDITNKVFVVNVEDDGTFQVTITDEVVYQVDLQVPGTATTPIPSDGTAGQLLSKASATAWDMLWIDPPASGVTSVFGRVGDVIAAAGDYLASQVTNDSTVAGADVAAALDTLGAVSHTHSNKLVLDQITDAGSGAIITDAERLKLNGIEDGAQVNTVTSVNTQTGAVVLGFADVGAAPTVHTHVEADITDLGDYLTDAPSDGGTYGRKDAAWAQITTGAQLPLGLGTWTYDNTATTPPLVGEIRFNNTNPALATKAYINETDGDAVNKGAVLAAVLETGAEIFLQDRADKNDYWLGEVVTATDQGTWFEVDLTNVSLNGTLADGEPMVLILLSQAATSAPVTSVFGRQGVVEAQTADYTWAQVDKAVSSLADITTRSHTLLTDVGTNTHPQVDAHIASVANPHSVTAAQAGAAPTVHTHPLTALEQSSAVMNDGVYWDGLQWVAGTLPAIVASKEPTGFVDRADSIITFVDSTRTYFILPAAGQFEIWQQGQQYIFTGVQSVVIPDTTGAHFIYFDGGTLQTTTVYSDDMLTKYAYVGYIYWNAAQGSGLLVGDERHGMVMSSDTHRYLHLTRGAAIESGLGLGSFTVDQSGDLDVHAQFAAVAGIYWDEDIELVIPADPLPANIPVTYLSGTGTWNMDAATDFPVKNFVGGSGRLAWNEFTGGVWQQTEVTNNDFVLCHIFATNDPNKPYIAIQGQDEYDSLGQARAGAIVELGNLTDPSGKILTPELIAIGTVIYQSSTGYTNAVLARVRSTDEGADYIPWTGGPETLQFGTPPASHTNLLDIGLNTHPQIDAHIADVTTNPHAVTADQVLPTQAGNAGQVLGTNGTTAAWEALDEAMMVQIEGTVSEQIQYVAPFDMTLTGWTMLLDVSGSMAVGVWKDTYANHPPTVADLIVTPTVTSAAKAQATGLSIAVAKGDCLIFNVNSVTTATLATVALTGVRA